MPGVMISPNLKKNRVQIDLNGNETDPKTGEFLGNVNQVYKPSKQELESAQNKEEPTKEEIAQAQKEIKEGVIAVPHKNQKIQSDSPTSNPLSDLVSKKVNEAVAKALEKIDIGKMVEEAIDKAFK